MNDDQLDDLKYYIDSRISQSEATLRADMQHGFKQLNDKIDSGFTGVGDAIEQITPE